MLYLPAHASTTKRQPLLNIVHCVDALVLMKALSANSIDCVVTSPPYWNLRDYNVAGQIGLEPTPQEFICRLMEVFTEVRRVLKPTGSCWVNLGDSYASGEIGRHDSVQGREIDGKRVTMKATARQQSSFTRTLPAKSLMMIPARFAIAMQDDGWILRSDIIWSKRAPMPESVTDRPTKSHEHIFLFAKEPHYFYDQEAVREKARQDDNRKRPFRNGDSGTMRRDNGNLYEGRSTRNQRDVWHLAPEASNAEHFAAFPTEIPRRCILAGCPEKVCGHCGTPYEREIEKTGGTIGKGRWGNPDELVTGVTRHGRSSDMNDGTYTRIDRGLHPTCDCNAGTQPGIVLDMFSGTGTTAVMARNLARNYIACDLNPDYVAMSKQRLADTDPFMDKQVTPELTQKSMFASMSL